MVSKPLCCRALLAWLSLFLLTSSMGWAHRSKPLDISAALRWNPSPRLGQSTTLHVDARSYLERSLQGELLLRLPPGVVAESAARVPFYLPARGETQGSFAVRFERPGTYPIQVSVYTPTLVRHFVNYIRLSATHAETSPFPLPGEAQAPLETQVRLVHHAPEARITVQGRALYFDDNDLQRHPIRRMRVELWEQDADADRLLDTLTTADDGGFRFPSIANVDPEDGSQRDLMIRLVAENEVLSIRNSHGVVYTWDSQPLQDVPDGVVELDVVLDQTNVRRGAGFIFNSFVDAYDFLRTEVGWSRSSIPVLWPSPENASFYSYFTQGGHFSDEISIASMDAWERSTLLHEYGHATMSPLYDNDVDLIPNGEYQMPHYVDTVSDPGFAMSEGWAEFMEAAVDDDALMVRGYSNRDWPNIEDNAWYTGDVEGKGNNRDGNVVEGAVASILWDITDTAQSRDLTPGEDDDEVADLFPIAWNILADHHPRDIRSLGEIWRDQALLGSPAVEVIFATHGVPLRPNQAPTIVITSPDEANRLASTVFPIRWKTEDPDGDAVSIDLLYTSDLSTGSAIPIAQQLDGEVGEYLWSTEAVPEGAYHILIRAYDSMGGFAEAVSTGKVIVDPTPLAPPTVRSSTHPDPNRWETNASPQFEIDSKGDQFSYVLDRKPDTYPDTHPDLTQKTISFQNLDDGIWWFHIRAHDPLGYWSTATHISFRIRTGVPTPPSKLRWLADGTPLGERTTATQLELVWDAANDLSGIARYEVRIRSSMGKTVNHSLAGETLRDEFVGQPGNLYTAQVRAVNQVGHVSAWSAEATIEIESKQPWDVNGDGQVDVMDLTIVALHFGEVVEMPLSENPDVNRDRRVDVLDLVLVGLHFGERGTLAAPAQLASGDAFLLPNYPNPFNPETWIPFVLTQGTTVRLSIYDVHGKLVRRLDLGYRPSGVYVTRDAAVHWDGRNIAGEAVASGSYFALFEAGDTRMVRKLVVAR